MPLPPPPTPLGPVSPSTPPRAPCRKTYAAFVCFGLASWVMTNTTWVELSYFMLHLPEKLSVFSYAMFALQSANIYPVLYMCLNARHQRLALDHAVWILLTIGFVVSVCMSFLWDVTTVMLGARHSIAMLILTHIGGMVSATTSVIFYPYVAMYPSIYTSALATGEGLSGSIAGLLGLVQRPYATDLTFSVSAFYLASTLIVVVSIVAFGFLQFHPKATGQRALVAIARENNKVEHGDESRVTDVCDAQSETASSVSVEEGQKLAPKPTEHPSIFRTFWKELLCLALLSGLYYGVVPSITSFLFARYSPDDHARAAKYQTVASTSIFLLDPAARFLTGFCRFSRVYTSTFLLSVAGALLLACTLTVSPPFSALTEWGFLFPLLLYVVSDAMFAYTQTMIVLEVKVKADTATDAEPHFAETAYQWCGFLIQMGSFTGTLMIFPWTLACPHMFQSSVSSSPAT